MYLAFAGVDGSGKTTQARRLTRWLEAEGLDATFAANESSLPLRSMLDRVAQATGHRDHVDLLGPDTAQLIRSVMKWRSLRDLPLAVPGPDRIVVADRGAVCQYALVRVFGGSNEAVVRAIFDDIPHPDLTLFIDLPGAEAARRVDARGVDRHTAGELDGLGAAYRSLPEFAGFTVIDGRPSADEVEQAIRDAVVGSDVLRLYPGRA